MRSPLVARTWFGATALVVLVGLTTQLVVTAGRSGPDVLFPSAPARIFNLFCYFTVQSNVIVGVTCALLALRLDRTSTLFRTFRLIGLVAIAVTGVVFHVALASLQDLHGSAAFADAMLHTVSPLMCVLGWLFLGPRGQASVRIAAYSVLFPLVWVVFTLVRGPIVDYYPYPFVDVTAHGYPRVVVNIVLVGVLFAGLALGATGLDRVLSRGAARAASRGT